MKPAFLVIDLQRAFCVGHAAETMKSACECINYVLPAFREKGLPVVWVQHRDRADGVAEGEPGFELIDALKVEAGDPRVTKEYGNSFNKTGLAGILRERGVDTVIIAGYCAEYCVLSTYRGAKDLDLVPILLRGGLASDEPENIGFVDRVSEAITPRALQKALENCGA
jgi:nicotinamidase-related amidase